MLTSQDKEKAGTDQRRYSLIDPSSESEVLRLQHRLVSTEDVLRNALEQGQQMEKLMEAMRTCSEKTQVACAFSGHHSNCKDSLVSSSPPPQGMRGKHKELHLRMTGKDLA